MSDHTTEQTGSQLTFRIDLSDVLRRHVREAIRVIFDEELEGALGCSRYERTEERRGYRNGTESRRMILDTGPEELQVPRGRLFQPDGSTTEFRSRLLPRYARRTRRINETILGLYLAGANTRRMKRALKPLFGETHLSKSAISRVVKRLQALFTDWDTRDLSQENYPLVFLDGILLKVRLARRVVSAPVLVVVGVEPDGKRRVVGLRLAASEAGACWRDFVASLEKRGLPEPLIVVTDGHKGLAKARDIWPSAKVQRCTRHKQQNLIDHGPKHARSEMLRDYRGMITADDAETAHQRYSAFLVKWRRLCPPVARSLEEAGLDLLTFYELPKLLWRSCRTTNGIENLNREFRRRTKNQGSFSTEMAAVTLLYGLLAFGQITLRRIDGYRALPLFLLSHQAKAA